MYDDIQNYLKTNNLIEIMTQHFCFHPEGDNAIIIYDNYGDLYYIRIGQDINLKFSARDLTDKFIEALKELKIIK